MEIHIFPMERGDIPALAELERQCFPEPWSEASLSEGLDNPQAVFFTAKTPQGELLGYAGMHDILGEGYFDNVAVFPEARGRGVGTALVGALCAYGKEKGLSFLTLEVRPSNAAALALYQKYGFAKEGVRKGFYRRPPEDGWILTKRFFTEKRGTSS